MGRVGVRVRVGVGVRVRVTDVRGLEQRLFLHRTEERDGHLSRVRARVRVGVRDRVRVMARARARVDPSLHLLDRVGAVVGAAAIAVPPHRRVVDVARLARVKG